MESGWLVLHKVVVLALIGSMKQNIGTYYFVKRCTCYVIQVFLFWKLEVTLSCSNYKSYNYDVKMW